MLNSHYFHISWITFATVATTVCATPKSTPTAAPTAIRLADAERCPVTPKPSCSDDTCQGSIFVCATQFICCNESPFTASDGRDVILAGCRCCPLPIEVWCHDRQCAAPEDTRICTAGQLQGCVCMTRQDRLAAIEASLADYPGAFDDSVDLLEPGSSSDDEPTNSSAQRTTMATMEPLIQRLPLQYAWGMDQSRNC
ncbi:hypothetical protein RRF57_002428 [Xylaria bambusicola]|uniref:Uncharacterized protein n=1 Tax=Xylaria bambusicola TaxID=326684 RepID=A0AAN7UDM3_9PEZI